ncbi:NADH-quinone oxidoreductase subunit C [Fibrobacter sp. UWB16]|jgi:NADH/F420H2 dehydrogenase subunit C|uniref:NADH-quinone oxidoreductase subunit C n=1 Tax=Fibrobacter succinogenes TaxID=833 RepID=A0A380RX03_FIBSU|nr:MULTISPECIES: NADH-quinone oxidoreductase subunit C [Fibrobacter]MBQ5462556.1 NADH-quinone oxidoreductase subunit C [Fibrobacter sp.]PWJ37843.1 NADH-quinone oxidoreductase subunit C/D [Fibrobacter succinogenes subsp. elongatus]SHM08391.1 NADH-quinone oxidoreductase subunit C [Fibrobacter sp. UWB7]SOD13413.1 NADH-quinone oxidoreductase subunit C [Fibrobacter sp. UWB16]SUQ20090.1 NADH dehydrogenase subunit C [Fibrobacter succinogenes]
MTVEEIFAALEGKFDVKREPLDKWGITAVVAAPYLHNAVQFLKEESGIKFDMLVDIAGIDYLTYPNHEGPRFAVSYAFKSMKNPGARIRLKVLVSEESLKVPTISDLYANANWYEREVYDQFGVIFEGHPDLRRLLNHVEFVGHPLRKDYPAQKRQWLSTNDYLLPELEKRLEELGYKVIQRSKEVETNDNEFLEGSIKA